MEGIDIRNTGGSFQVNSNTRVTAFLRKGVVTTSRKFPQEGTWYSTSARIPADLEKEVVAFRCNQKASILASVGGNIEVGCEGTSPSQVEFWVFGKSETVSTQGLQVFDGAGVKTENLLYDSSWVPIKPVSILEAGTNVVGAGNWAVVPMNIRSSVVRKSVTTGQTTKRTQHKYTRKDQSASFSGSNIEIGDAFVEHYELTVFYNTGQIPPPDGTTEYSAENNGVTQYMLIDVTGL